MRVAVQIDGFAIDEMDGVEGDVSWMVRAFELVWSSCLALTQHTKDSFPA